MATRNKHYGYRDSCCNNAHCCNNNINNRHCKNNNNNDEMVPIYFNEAILHRIAFTVWHTALHLESEQHSYDASTKNFMKNKQQAALMSQPRMSTPSSSKSPRSRGDSMDLSYVTERIIALWVPGDVGPVSYRQGQQQAANMLQTKHGNNYMVFNLSEPRRAARSHHERVRELGWPPDLAPPLERLCSVCKDIDSWLSGDSHRIAVIHARGSKDRIGVVIAAYMHYSSICGSADQALDRFAMNRFLNDKVGDLEQPSHRRYVEYFSGLLSGSIRINSAPLYLTHVTVLGAPAFEAADCDATDAAGGCRAFLKVYEGLVPVYTSGVHSVCGGTRQFTVNVAGERQRRGLQLRGDILIKCYHRHYGRESRSPASGDSPTRSNTPLSLCSDRPQRELIFACQFHTCAVSDYTLSFTRQELDAACNDLRFPLDGAVELHFSATPEVRLPSPAPTPAVPVHMSDDPVTRWDSYENLSLLESPLGADSETEDANEAEVNHTYGPLDGSLYATIAKKEAAGETVSGGPVIGSPHTVSMDSGISSAGNGLLHHQSGATKPGSNNTSNASSTSPPLHCNGHGAQSPSTPLSPEESHRALDELLNDMLQTVENIPDLPPSASTSPYANRGFSLDDLEPPQQFHYSPPPLISADVISPPPRSASYSASLHHKQLNNGYGSGDTGAPSGGDIDQQQEQHAALLQELNFIDAEESIPYHARQDSRPFTYGAIPTPEPSSPAHQPSGSMLQMHPGLSSPSLVRKASFKTTTNGTTATLPRGSPLATSHQSLSSSTTLRHSPSVTSHPSPDLVDGDLSPPNRDYLHNNGGSSSTSPRSPEFHDGHIVGGSNITSSNNLTWLQRQQQKLRERKEVQLRTERYPTETRLITELRTIQQHSYNRVLRPSASHRIDGYTSDTTHFADDDEEDFTVPLHIITSPTHKPNSVGSAPASPLLPNRSSSRRYYVANTNHQQQTAAYNNMCGVAALNRQKSDTSFDRERPFVAVKRAHEQTRKYAETQLRDDSYSSWRTTSISDEAGSPPRSNSPRPQTPAFPVHPRTPYVNNSSQQFDTMSSTGLPPKSPTTQRRLNYSGSLKNLRKWPSNSSVSSKDRSPSPVSDPQTSQQHSVSFLSNSSTTNRGVGFTPHSSGSISDSFSQQSPKSPGVTNGSTGQSSPTVYYGHSRRSSLHSNSEPPQEVSPAHVKFVRDTSRFWYKPAISREEAINMLRNEAPGTFVVRDSNSFPGAFGLALKVATPPPGAQGKPNNSNDPATELVRHFLIEPTSRGVKLKGCSNEPVFSSLSALVYQHSLMQMALPCKLLLPEVDGARLASENSSSVSTAQLLLAQGAACNVLFLFTLDVESLTGPQAVKKAVQQMFLLRPLPMATVVHFKVSGQGITLTDNKRQLFFRRHYPVNTISYCGLDPDDHRWSQKSEETGMPISSNRCFGFVARKLASKTDNQCHVFAELEPEQPASAIVNFVSKVMMSGGTIKANIV